MSHLRHRYGVDCTTTQTRIAFARYGLTGHAEDGDGVMPGHWEPAGCEDYETALAAWGGLAELHVYSGCHDMERESFTEWGTPGGSRPVVAGIVRHPRGNGCFHLIYVPDEGHDDPHEMAVRERTLTGAGRTYREVMPSAAPCRKCGHVKHYPEPCGLPVATGYQETTPCSCRPS